jgi:hypothetical protein
MVDTVYGYKGLKRRQIYKILKNVNDRKIQTNRRASNPRKRTILAS